MDGLGRHGVWHCRPDEKCYLCARPANIALDDEALAGRWSRVRLTANEDWGLRMRLTDSLPRVAILLGLAAIFALAGCGTKKNTASRRFYHRTTSYFNYYFNARDAYRMGERTAMENVRYDFTRPLPFSLAGLPEASVETGGEMDRVIEKCAELIRYHSITAKPTRASRSFLQAKKPSTRRTSSTPMPVRRGCSLARPAYGATS